MTREPGESLWANAYHSYLVRFWQSNEQGHWRASAQCVQTGNTILFGTVENLIAFLQTEINEQPSQHQSVEWTEAGDEQPTNGIEQGAN